MAFYRRRPRPDAEKCADPAKARASALETLAGQEVSANMLYERLCRRYTEQAAAAAVAEMVQLDYVNDARYAEARAHSLLAARKSRRAAAQSLRQKGLAPAEVAGALEAVYAPEDGGDDPELEAAAALVDSRYRKKLAIGRRDLVVAALQRRGFAPTPPLKKPSAGWRRKGRGGRRERFSFDTKREPEKCIALRGVTFCLFSACKDAPLGQR